MKRRRIEEEEKSQKKKKYLKGDCYMSAQVLAL